MHIDEMYPGKAKQGATTTTTTIRSSRCRSTVADDVTIDQWAGTADWPAGWRRWGVAVKLDLFAAAQDGSCLPMPT